MQVSGCELKAIRKVKVINEATNHLSSKLVFLAVIIFLGILLTIALTHRAGYVFSGNALNPDEAEFLAAGKLASQNLNPYESYSTSTYGPLLIQILGVIGWLGAPLTLPWAHLLSFFLLLGILALPFKVAVGSRNSIYLLGVVAPIALVTISGINSVSELRMGEIDFLALNSELLPLFLISLILVIRKTSENSKSFELVVGLLGFLASISKLQIAPIFLMVTIWFYILNIERQSVKIRITKIYIAYFALWLGFLGLLGLSSNLKAYFRESLFLTASYVSSNHAANSFFVNLFEAFHLLLIEPMIFFASAYVLFLGLKLNFSDQGTRRKILLTLFLPFFAIVVPGNNFGHYKWLFIWTLLYLPIFLLTQMHSSRIQKNNDWFSTWNDMQIAQRILLIIPTFLIAIPLFENFVMPEKLPISQFTNMSVAPEESRGETVGVIADGLYSSEVASLCPQGSHVLIWGWAAELYSYYGWTPTPRLVNDSVRVISRNPNSEWVISNVLDVIRTKKATCIIDASGEGFFGGKSGRELSKNKKIFKELDANYRIVNVENFDGIIYLSRTK